jgi:hypothetical protein
MNYAAIAAAMQAEIDNPLKLYMPNSPGAFVRDRLFKDCYWEEAAYFWLCYCNRDWFNEELQDLYIKLLELTVAENMPGWGTRGT